MRIAVLGFAAAAVALVAAGGALACGAGDQRGTEAGDTGPLALYPGEWSGDDAALDCTLVREGPCLYIEFGPNPTGRYLVAFSEQGTSWDEAAQAVRIPRATLKVGQQVEVGGGELGAAYVDAAEWVVRPNPACDLSNVWIAGLSDD